MVFQLKQPTPIAVVFQVRAKIKRVVLMQETVDFHELMICFIDLLQSSSSSCGAGPAECCLRTDSTSAAG